MKCTIPEISWHNRDPVLSLDIQPVANEKEVYRLASGGTDTLVLIWHLVIIDNGAVSIEPVSELKKHQKAVNVVRWSPSGQYLASGDDDADIIVWQQKTDELSAMLDGETSDKENWSLFKVLRGHKEDIYDLTWSPTSTKLISGSVDNTAIIWDLTRGLNDNILTEHKGFVQGVSWDPLGHCLATLTSDRVCRIYNENGSRVISRISKGTLPVPEHHPLYGQTVRYFHDDTFKSYFRRLSFSPDGSLLVTPAGYIESWENNKALYCSYIFNMNSLVQPALILPSPHQYTIVIRFCPILFELRPEGPDPVIVLPYRMIFAIATKSSVVLYDTQQMNPYAVLSNIHYTRLTDLTWSYNGRLLAISSTDGYCTLVTFKEGELGKEYVKEESDIEEVTEETECSEAETSLQTIEEKKEKKPSFLEKWTLKIQKDKAVTNNEEFKKEHTETQPHKLKNDTEATPKVSKEKAIATKKMDIEIDGIEILEPNETFKGISNNLENKDKINILTPRSKRTLPEQSTIKSADSSPLSSKKKPRIEQTNIKSFFEPLKESPKAKKAKATKITDKKENVIIINDDSNARDAINLDNKENKLIEEPKIQIIEDLVIDESQNMKLILEVDDDEIEENGMLEKEVSLSKELDQLSVEQVNEIIMGENKSEEKLVEFTELPKAKNVKEFIVCKNNTEKLVKPTEISTNSPHVTLPTIAALPNDLTSQKKRVPFITLSSPKNKKFCKK